jgi:hypothetical protein
MASGKSGTTSPELVAQWPPEYAKVLNIKVCSPLKLHNDLTGNYHAICHYSYKLPSGLPALNER